MTRYKIGVHVPVIEGVKNVPLLAQALGAEAFAFFTKNQKQWKGKPLTEDDIRAFQGNLQKVGISPTFVLPHNGYLINIGNPYEEKRKKSLESLKEEAERARLLGLETLNFHPGSHLGLLSEQECFRLVASGMNEVLEAVPQITLVLETTAGQGNSIGYRFEHLAELIQLSLNPERVGICIDTCHIFAAGYELRTDEGYEATFQAFSTIIGFHKLKGVHLNDSRSTLGSRIDRHASIGKGELGIETFVRILRDPRFEGVPLILETPNPSLWPDEIAFLKEIPHLSPSDPLPPLRRSEDLTDHHRLLPGRKLRDLLRK
ncbi:MAG: deoxyribonuclease IV [Spirochaetes bacterium]|nr:deoxyribonuclease IV [Spirochaetota bacterium]